MQNKNQKRNQNKIGPIQLVVILILYGFGMLFRKMRTDVKFVFAGLSLACFIVIGIGLSMSTADRMTEEWMENPMAVTGTRLSEEQSTINHDGFLGMEFEHADAAGEEETEEVKEVEEFQFTPGSYEHRDTQLPSRGSISVVVPTQIPAQVVEAAAVEPEVEEAATPEVVIADENTDTSGLEYLGTFTITHYCCENYPHICNDGDATRTASGEAPIPFKTCAIDPKEIPMLSTIVINGKEYRCNDTGGAIKQKRIDLCVDTHQHAMDLGKYQAEVYIKR